LVFSYGKEQTEKKKKKIDLKKGKMSWGGDEGAKTNRGEKRQKKKGAEWTRKEKEVYFCIAVRQSRTPEGSKNKKTYRPLKTIQKTVFHRIVVLMNYNDNPILNSRRWLPLQGEKET